MKKLFRVVAQTPTVQVPSQEGGQETSVCNVVLQELGGKFENSYVVSLYGNTAMCKYMSGSLVYGALHFRAKESNGQWYQNIVAKELLPINNGGF